MLKLEIIYIANFKIISNSLNDINIIIQFN